MRYIYSRIGIFFKSLLKGLFGDHTVLGGIVCVLLTALLVAATILGVRSIWFEQNAEVETEDPIESYDNVVEIIIGDDGEVDKTDPVAPSEE